MSLPLRFNRNYFLLAILLLIIEILIGRYMKDALIRPYGGDYLVVILIYCFIRTFLDTDIRRTALSVLIFSYLVEISQYLNLADRLGFKKHGIARILVGDYFTWNDIISYTLGILTVIVFKKLQRQLNPGINEKRS